MQFQEKVEKTAKNLATDGVVSASEIADALDLVTKKDKEPMWVAIKLLRNKGVLKQVERGRYEIRDRKWKKITKKEKMWKLVRSRKVVTAEDLQELAGTSYQYAYDWLKAMVRLGAVKREKNRYTLVVNTVKQPVDEKQRESSRRQWKKQSAKLKAGK
ncbi:MAG: hypothetical protein GY749_40270 [Desulfobacteraceae bacterium]|nr:hypothetical protein [Desulfobacteraceae bacterium]